MASSCLVISVKRGEPELVVPHKATPKEVKPLSDIDDQESLRVQVPYMQFYSPNQSSHKSDGDPARVIKEALGKALVYYYPWAGRLREWPNRKLVVDCTGEGVLYVEAEADVNLKDIVISCGGFLCPPFPKDLLSDVPGSSGILHCPLLLFQVTKLKCGGFVVAVRMNHTMADASGLVKLLKSIAELAQGALKLSVQPVWERNLLCSRDPPRVTCKHHEYGEVEGACFPIQRNNNNNMVIEHSFFFGPTELSYLRQRLQPHQQTCSTFVLLSAFLWQCAILSLRFEPHQEVRNICVASVWSKVKPRLPGGYYGNGVVFPAAVCSARDVTGNGPNYAVDLTNEAKAKAKEEYIRSMIDFMATHGRPPFAVTGSWLLADNTQLGYLDIDFGWGKPVYGGPSCGVFAALPGSSGALIKGVNDKGESGVLALVSLHVLAMESFATEIHRVVGNSSSPRVQPKMYNRRPHQLTCVFAFCIDVVLCLNLLFFNW